MLLGRVIGWIILLLAIAAAGSDLWGFYDTGYYQAATIGELWQRIDRESLIAIRAPLESIAAWLWDPVTTTLLGLPAALTLAVVALLALLAFRRKEKRRRR
jgi:hypothetical protein